MASEIAKLLRVNRQTLLREGNSKLGEGIYTFSLPAMDTCPGSSPVCRKECYALRGRMRFLKASYNRSLEASKAPGFASRMASEIRRRFVACVRIHVAGDFYSAAYVRAWVEVARACPGVRFFAYTRSWRIADMAAALAELALLKNVRLWYSCDRDTGVPGRVPARVRLAWMQAAADEVPPRADLVFRVMRLRRAVVKRVGLAMVCPVENGATGHRTDCGRCRVCLT
jgi:hypothetical protein